MHNNVVGFLSCDHFDILLPFAKPHRKQVKETEETKYSNCGRRQVCVFTQSKGTDYPDGIQYARYTRYYSKFKS